METKTEVRDEEFGRVTVAEIRTHYSDFMTQLFLRAVQEAATELARQFVAQHAQEIFKMMDPQAVANLAVANSGAEIAKEMKKEAATTTRIITHEKTRAEVYQRGLFGGMKRIG